MCGIAGIFNTDRAPILPEILQKMTDSIIHRGPDDAGTYISDGIGLGFRRLAILDLSQAGHQPMSTPDGRFWLIFNGEIYNYQDIRSRLISEGVHFRSQTDSEVLLYAYQQYGKRCLDLLNGMFAFVIWDEKEKKLFAARDRFGIKPFYYTHLNHTLIWGSEIKAILQHPHVKRRLNEKIAYDYLSYYYQDHTYETFFDQIFQLRGGYYLELGLENRLQVQRYWDLVEKPDLVEKTVADNYAKFYNLFEDSVKLQLHADVPVGTCLSGGLDSSSIVCVANKLLQKNLGGHLGDRQQTFSACSHHKIYDERYFIDAVVDHTKVKAHYTYPDDAELWTTIQKFIWHQDEPFGGTSMYAQWCVMKLAKENGVTVMLDGQGADEVLGGYHRYFSGLFADEFVRGHFRGLQNQIQTYYTLHQVKDYDRLAKAAFLFFPIKRVLKSLIKGNADYLLQKEWSQRYNTGDPAFPAFNSWLQKMMYRDITQTNLPMLLRYEDRNSMAHSIEARVPFLDHRLVEFVFSLPNFYKIDHGWTKCLIRETLKGVLPELIRTRIDKMGFVTPEPIWFRSTSREFMTEIFQSESFKQRGIFNIPAIMNAFDDHCNSKRNLSLPLWRMINFELWSRMFMDSH